MLNFTYIHEQVRAAFGISGDEYRLLNYIQTWAGYNEKAPGWCDRTQAEISHFVGITDRGLRKMLARLDSKNLIQKNGKTGQFSITERWSLSVKDAELSSGQEEQSSASVGTKFRLDRNKVPHLEELSSEHIKELKEYKNTLLKEKESEPQKPKTEIPTPLEAPLFSEKTLPGAAPKSNTKTPDLSAVFARFDNPAFAAEIWQRWTSYRAEIRKPYKSQDSIETALKNLIEYSGGVAQLAKQIIEKSIGNGYQGFFKPEPQTQSRPTTRPVTKSGINHFGGDPAKYLEPQAF